MEENKKNWKEIIFDLNTKKEERIQAAFHLENDPEDDAAEILAKALKTEPSPIVRHEIAFSLGETSNPKIAGPALKEAVETDENIFVRHEAILALATLGKGEYADFIKKYLDDPIPEMAESAEIALQRVEETGNH